MTLSTDDLLIEIVDVLEEQGVDPEKHTIYEYVDPDALAKVVTSAETKIEIRIIIEGLELRISQDDIHAAG